MPIGPEGVYQHIDIGSGDIPLPHVDDARDTSPPPHVDAVVPHIDIGYNHWWQNWPKTHGYVAARMLFPTSIESLVSRVRLNGGRRSPESQAEFGRINGPMVTA